MLTQTPVPQELRIDLTDYSLIVPDLSKPVWHGPYHDSTLSIYEAKIEAGPNGVEFAASVTYLCILVDGASGANFVTYGHYVRGTPVEDICAHLQATVYDAYLEQLAEAKQSSYVPGTPTLQ